MRSRLPALVLVLLVSPLGGCRRDGHAPEAPAAAPVELPRRPGEPLLGVRHARRPIVPLPPVAATGAERPDPCGELAALACALLPEGAQECLELRARVRRLAPERGREQCAHAVARHKAEEVVPARQTPCKELIARRCAVLGEETDGCALVRRRLSRAKDEPSQKGCLADLLVLEGLGGE